MSLPKSSVDWFSSYILIYNVGGGTKTVPIILSPTGLSENITASFDQQISPGRSAPIISYTNTGARTMTFSMRVSVNTLPDSYRRNIDLYISRLKSMLYPDYSDKHGVINGPHCLVVIGSIRLDGVCTSFSASYPEVYAKNGRYSYADIDLSFQEVLQVAPGNVTIYNRNATSGDASLSNKDSFEYISGTNGGNAKVDTSPKLYINSIKDSFGNTGEKQSNPYLYEYNDVFWDAYAIPYAFTTLDVVFDELITFHSTNELREYINHAGQFKDRVFVITIKMYYDGKLVDNQTKVRYIRFGTYGG